MSSVDLGWLAWGGLLALLVPKVRTELIDVVEYRWTRWRARRRVPRAQVIAPVIGAGVDDLGDDPDRRRRGRRRGRRQGP